MKTKHVSFDNIVVDEVKLDEFGGFLPRTEFDFEYNGEEWICSYLEADETFTGKTFDEALQKLIAFLNEDEVIAKLGEYTTKEGSKTMKETKKVTKKTKSSGKNPKPKSGAGSKKSPHPGVIATIVKTIERSGEKGVTKEQILKVLTKTFPDREERAMKNTINVQVPSRISKEKFPVERTENGTYRKVD